MSKEHFVKLMDHARKITQELNVFCIELTPSVRREAEQKVEYAQKVLQSLEAAAMKMDAADPELRELTYSCLISVKPHLELGIGELQRQLASNAYFKDPSEQRDDAPAAESAPADGNDEGQWRDAVREYFENRRVRVEESDDVITLGSYGGDDEEEIVEYEVVEEEIEEEEEE